MEIPKPQAPPPPPLASSASVKVSPAAAKTKTGFDLLRPVRYLLGFVKGTWKATLDGMANGGHKGMWIGTGLGTLLLFAGVPVFAGMGLAAIAFGWAGGLATGAVVGGTVGLVTGGIRGMDRESRKDKYAEDLMEKTKARQRHGGFQPDYRDARREYSQRSDYILDRVFQQEREYAQDARHYFRDMVDHSRGPGPHGHGF